MNPPERIETERLTLRKPRRDDAPAIFSAYAQDLEVTRYMTWRPHKSVGETYRIVELMLKLWDDGGAYSYVITLKYSDSAIGMIAMHPEGFKVSIGYVLARQYWSKGYTTEAALAVTNWLLKQPDIYRVFATCDIENPASAHVMEKAGMQREGILRRYIVHPNISDEPRDSYMYAIVKKQ
jgi:[ribosomal protein S5]-alanine N-acetyltransferase